MAYIQKGKDEYHEMSLLIFFIGLFSDPDRYRFRTVTLPPDLTDPPHSADSDEITITESTTGDPIKGQ